MRLKKGELYFTQQYSQRAGEKVIHLLFTPAEEVEDTDEGNGQFGVYLMAEFEKGSWGTLLKEPTYVLLRKDLTVSVAGDQDIVDFLDAWYGSKGWFRDWRH